MSTTKKINESKLQERIGFKPHEQQQQVIKAFNKGVREIVLNAGRRFGKSALCAYLALTVLLQPDKRVWIVSPTYDLSLKVFTYLIRWFSKVAPSQMSGVTYRPVPKIRTANGSILECKSAENPKSLLGDELDLIIVDEAARLPEVIWTTYLFPATASRQGRTVFISTPFGKNWFFRKFMDAAKYGGAFVFPSSQNPFFPREELERAKFMLPKSVYSQEYEAEFVSDSTAVFRGVNEVINSNCLSDVISGHNYIMGVDLARYNDFTVLTVIDIYNNNVVYIERFNQISWSLQKERIKAASRRYNNARIIMDSTGIGDPIAEDLITSGIIVDDIKYTANQKKQLIEKLSIFIEQKLINIPPLTELIDELESYGYNVSEKGTLSYSAPSGKHDDCVNSLALAVWGLIGQANPRTAVQQELQRQSGNKRNKIFI